MWPRRSEAYSYFSILGDEHQPKNGLKAARRKIVYSSATTTYNGIKVSRNNPCPCGSGKKFKKCHGSN